MLLLLTSLLFQSTSYAKTVQIEADDLLVRSGPGTEYELIGHVNQDEDYSLVEQTDEWLAINFNGETGWVSRQYATVADQANDSSSVKTETPTNQSETDQQAELSNQSFDIPVDVVHLRSQATTQSEILTTLTEGETVTIIEQAGDWLQIIWQDTEGFIPSWLLDFQEPMIESQTSLKNKVIVIDPGHGGNDSGAVGVNGLLEKILT